jgi:hypothetical protein
LLLFVTIFTIHIDDPAKDPNAIVISTCYAIFMAFYHHWDSSEMNHCLEKKKDSEENNCSDREIGFYKEFLKWEKVFGFIFLIFLGISILSQNHPFTSLALFVFLVITTWMFKNFVLQKKEFFDSSQQEKELKALSLNAQPTVSVDKK